MRESNSPSFDPKSNVHPADPRNKISVNEGIEPSSLVFKTSVKATILIHLRWAWLESNQQFFCYEQNTLPIKLQAQKNYIVWGRQDLILAYNRFTVWPLETSSSSPRLFSMGSLRPYLRLERAKFFLELREQFQL